MYQSLHVQTLAISRNCWGHWEYLGGPFSEMPHVSSVEFREVMAVMSHVLPNNAKMIILALLSNPWLDLDLNVDSPHYFFGNYFLIC